MWKRLAPYGTHNAEKRCGTFIRSQCEILEFGVQGRFIRATLARGYRTSSVDMHAGVCLLVCLFVGLFFLPSSGVWVPLAFGTD